MTQLALIFVWLVGLRDYALTRWLIETTAPSDELNALARWIATTYGAGALLPYKLASLTLFTTLVCMIARRDRGAARSTSEVALVIHACLAIWWNHVLRAHGFDPVPLAAA